MQNILQPLKNYVKKHKKAFTVLFILLLISSAISYWYVQSSHNLAKDVAKPIEKSLIQAGATKVCEHGDAGHGPDNFSPWYYAYYSINKPENEAISIIKEAAQDNGYVIVQASSQDQGTAPPVPDELLGNWYFNSNDKSSFYDELESGKIILNMTVNLKETQSSCTGRQISLDENNSIVSIEIGLPRFKK